MTVDLTQYLLNKHEQLRNVYFPNFQLVHAKIIIGLDVIYNK